MNPNITQSLNRDVCGMSIYNLERTENKFYTFDVCIPSSVNYR